MSMKRCSKCDKEKPATAEYFSRQYTGRDGLRADCKVCAEEYLRKWRAANRGTQKPLAPDGYKICTKCGEIKPATTEYFYHQARGRQGLSAECKVCQRMRRRERYAAGRS
jgi:hypothetical protein